MTAALDRLLGLRVDLRKFYRLASQDAKLNQLVRRFPGVKPPRFPNVFEALVNAIACQQLSRWLRLKRPPGYDHVRRVLHKWRPYAGLIYFHLLLDGLDRRGWVT